MGTFIYGRLILWSLSFEFLNLLGLNIVYLSIYPGSLSLKVADGRSEEANGVLGYL